MVPDVVVTAPGQAGSEGRLIVLDAKYRISEGLNEAINSIHTYRDALVEEVGSGKVEGFVTAAYLLTPHIPELAGDYRATQLPGRLFHPEYREAFRFGAVTLRPGMSAADLRQCLRTIVADATA
jgi:PD-(D/E)XK nuclease superfamily